MIIKLIQTLSEYLKANPATSLLKSNNATADIAVEKKDSRELKSIIVTEFLDRGGGI
jgi:hypothetical protein